MTRRILLVFYYCSSVFYYKGQQNLNDDVLSSILPAVFYRHLSAGIGKTTHTVLSNVEHWANLEKTGMRPPYPMHSHGGRCKT